MHVSSNIIRFPDQPVSPLLSERDQEEAAKIVGFPTPEADESAVIEMQERGQVFAAHRISSRVADQLDSIAAL
jgi:hypothetical protein